MVILHAMTVFAVGDLERALGFYIGVLGFEQVRRFDSFAAVRRDGCRIGLAGPGDPRRRTPGSGEVYVVCDEVEAYHAAVLRAGAVTDAGPTDQTYGMRDFIVRDPDGNVLTFGMRRNGRG